MATSNPYSNSLLMDALRGSLSNAESFGRGFAVAPVGLLGDIEGLLRKGVNLSFGRGGVNVSETPVLPTTEGLLSSIPRMTAPRMETAGMEQIGSATNPRGPINLGRAVASLPSDVARAGREFMAAGQPARVVPPSVAKKGNLIQIEDKVLPITMHKLEEKAGNQIVNINPEAFDKAFSKTDWQYVGKGGEGGIEGRYKRFENWLKDAKSMTASNVSVNKDGGVVFGDGRHRYAVLRDMGLNKLPISMDAESIKNAKKFGYIADESSFQYPQEEALRLAQQRAALPIEQGGLGLIAENTPEMRAKAMNAIDYLHGTERMDRLLAGKNFDPRKATSGPMPFGTNTPEMASNYAMNKADTSLALNNFGNLEDYFQVMPKSMGERGTSPINVENVWYRLSPEKKSEILDKASRIGYEIPEEAGGGFVLHPTSEGMPYSKSHWDYVLNRESKGNPLTALRKTFAESGMLDAYAPSELADIYKLAGFPYEITQTNAPWTSAQGVFTGKALISNPINTSDTATLQEKVIPFLKEQFKNDRTRVKTGGVDQWDKNTRFTPKQWVNQLEEDLSKGKNSFVWTSIPDKVTKQLEQLGFNGILDTGGKMGGEAHQVVIPFRPEQLRSRFAAFDPFRKDVATATAMGVALPDLLAAEYNQQPQSSGLLYTSP